MKMNNYCKLLLKPKRILKCSFIIFCTIFILIHFNLLTYYQSAVKSDLLPKNINEIHSINNDQKLNISFFMDHQDYSTLLNISNFKFLMNNPSKCNSTNQLFMIIFVHSALGNFEKRNVIRQTWGNEKLYVNSHNQIKIVFMVGVTNDSQDMERARRESQTHNDMVQGSFVDSYRNMTYKHVMGLKWIAYFCPNAQYVFKADDDLFVDLFQLTYYLKGVFGSSPHNLIACHIHSNAKVYRGYRSKWRVSHLEFASGAYPRYCAGWSIIMSPDVALNLYRISRTRPFFWIDDVFVSGILASDLNIAHYDMNARVYKNQYDIDSWLQTDEISLPPMFSQPNSDANQIINMWNKTVKYYRVHWQIDFAFSTNR